MICIVILWCTYSMSWSGYFHGFKLLFFLVGMFYRLPVLLPEPVFYIFRYFGSTGTKKSKSIVFPVFSTGTTSASIPALVPVPIPALPVVFGTSRFWYQLPAFNAHPWLVGCKEGVGQLPQLWSWRCFVATVAKLGFDGCNNWVGLLQGPVVVLPT